jgi:hypothetical protein
MTVLGRHAVVIIHGIGEQAPLSTVRSFVGRRTPRSQGEELRGGVVSREDRVFAEPSPVPSRTDDLVYSVTWNQSGRAQALRDAGWSVQERSAVTEFYEFYWAPRYRTTSLGNVTGWLLPLLLRRLRSFSTPRLRGPRGVVRALPGVALVLALLAVAALVRAGEPWWASVAVLALGVLVATTIGTFLGLIATVKVIALCVAAGAVGAVLVWGLDSVRSTLGAIGTSAVLLAAGTWIASIITSTLGDAARYLASDKPVNVEENEAIRSRVLDLVEELHAATDPDTGRPRYDRVVVVGHSLGSVIAYDAVRLAWARSYRDVVLPDKRATGLAAEAVRRVEGLGPALRAGGAAAEQAGAGVESWTAAQRAAGRAFADLPPGGDPAGGGRRWIVSDLVTLGCPLTYADAFMASSDKDLEDRFIERSLAADPPVEQAVRRAASHPYRMWIPGSAGPDGTAGPGTTRWHHAAPFATVRWTNAWFEHDIVGGPVGPHFGPGVRDVSLGGTRWLAGMAFAYPHSSYWVASKRSLVRKGSDASRALLRATIQRRPTLLLTARSPLDDRTLGTLAALLASRAAPIAQEVDVRLYVGATDAARRGAPFPLETVALPAHDLLPEIRALLGEGGRVALLVSPDLLADEKTAASPVDAEPAEDDEPAGEEGAGEEAGDEEAEALTQGVDDSVEEQESAGRRIMPVGFPWVEEAEAVGEPAELELDTVGARPVEEWEAVGEPAPPVLPADRADLTGLERPEEPERTGEEE